MNGRARILLLTALLAGGSAGAVGAQQRMMQAPPPLEQSDPRGPVARGLVTPLLAGDRAAAEAYLLRNAAAALSADAARAQLNEVVRQLEGEHEVATLRQAPDGAVLVSLRKKGASQPSLALVIGMEASAPHRITSVQAAQLRVQIDE